MALSLPLILFLLDWLQDRRLTWRTVVEKIPYVTLAIQIAAITYLFHARSSTPDLFPAVLTWCWTFTFYLKTFLFPFVLLPIYRLPHPVSLLNPQFALAIIILVIFLLSFWRFRQNRLWVFACWYYFLSIFFLLRFDAAADVYIVADRYMYLPSLGFCLFIGFQADRVLNLTREMSGGIRRMTVVFLVVLAVILSGRTFFLCHLWGDEGRLWRMVIRWAPQQALAYNNMGNYYQRRGDNVQAVDYYNKALGYSSEFDPLVYRHIGIAYAIQKKDASAMDYFNRSLGARSPCLDTYLDRGRLQARLGNVADAFHDYAQAIEHDPELPLAYHERALLYYQKGDLEHAADDFSRAIEKAPNFLTAYYFRGQIYNMLGRPDQARADFATVLRMDPGHWGIRASEKIRRMGTAASGRTILDVPSDTYEQSLWDN
jgi:Tfp pilus assembly protein PilF